MAKLRVYQLANQYEIPSKAFVDLLNQHNIPVKNNMSMLTDSQIAEIEAIKDQFSLDVKAVQRAIDKQQKIETKEKAAKEKAEAEKKEALRKRKAKERAEVAQAAREQQEEEMRKARELELKKKAEREAERKKENERKAAEAAKAAKAAEAAKAEEAVKAAKAAEAAKIAEEKAAQEAKAKIAKEKEEAEKAAKAAEAEKAAKAAEEAVQTEKAANSENKTGEGSIKEPIKGEKMEKKGVKSEKPAKNESKDKSSKKVDVNGKHEVKAGENNKKDKKGKKDKKDRKQGASAEMNRPQKDPKQGNTTPETPAKEAAQDQKNQKKKQKSELKNEKSWNDQGTGGRKKENGKKDKKDKKNKNNSGSQDNAPALKVRDHSKKGKTSHSSYKKQKAEIKSEKQKNQVFEIAENITVGNLAETLGITATEIIKTLMMAGTMASINQEIDYDTAAYVAEELGFRVEKIAVEDVMSRILEEYDEADTGNAVKRPPVVTVMGHVDHGKTSLLDRIRQANVTAEEAGGITQHIGAYTVTINGEKITFIDTPGHEAFTAMRLRGAQMTDIAVLVVAADDGVMPQTVEAINHAKAANVPIIVAINKIDKDGANPERVKQALTEHNLVVEEWGGDVIAVPVSAKKGIGIEDLLENILLVAEVEELTADPTRAARGCVIEAQMKQGKGSTASLLVQQGTLHVGDTIISGMTYGKIRTMIDDKGRRIKKAGPSQPVEISGLSEVPVAGDDFIVLENEKEARQLAEQRQQMEKESRQSKTKVNLNDLFSRIQQGEVQDVNIIIKADVQGSVEAIAQSLIKLNTEEVRINVIHGAVGAVNESDVMLASTSDAIIIGFNVRPDKNALAQAENEQVDIRLYRVIYDAIEDVKKAMEGLLSPDYIEKTTGSATVREVFRIPGGTMIAGSYVNEGKIGRADEVRIIRDGIVVFEGKIASLRRFKDDVKEVNTGFECGIGIEKFNDIKIGDEIETFVMEAVAREL